MKIRLHNKQRSFLLALAMVVALSPVAVAVRADSGAGDGVTHTKVAFVTSVTGNGDLSTWDDAGGLSGAAAGDAICQARASAGGLLTPGDFKAWLSTAADDAYCRIHGLSWERQNNCGQGALPNNAGPWERTDGLPFLPDIGTATSDGTAYYPPALDEFGQPAPGLFYHGTAMLGEESPSGTCMGWTSSSADAQLGSSRATTSSWAGNYISGNCATPKALLCLEAAGSGPALTLDQPLERLAFVTSITGTGDLSTWQPHAGGATGIEAGHAICRSLATDAGLPMANEFYAWLSDDTTDALDHFSNDGPWSRLDGVVISESLGELTDNSLDAPINVDENGDYVIYTPNVWTGTGGFGTAEADHCGGWTMEGLEGRTGIPVDGGLSWTRFFATAPCVQVNRLYCLSNAAAGSLYRDGFEDVQ